MIRTLLSLAIAAAVGLLCGPAWQSARHSPKLGADQIDPFADSDDDFLPDSIEWALVTNPQRADTDGDGIPDFVEVVQHGSPCTPNPPLPADNEMRLVITSTPSQCPSNGPQTWLHLLFRFMGQPTTLSNFQCWIQIGVAPGLRIPLDSLGSGPLVFRQRDAGPDGLWVTLSVPLASENLLRVLLPCTIGAQATIGTRAIRTGVQLFDIHGSTASLVPFHNGFAVQPINPACALTGGGSNRICVLGLTEAGSGPGGTAYQVSSADCDDCNDLECGIGCTETLGWVFVIPGGIETITGGG
jgi:hypothetical protein